MANTKRATMLLAAVAAVLTLSACQSGTAARPTTAAVPPAAKITWSGSYSANIQPVFDQHCVGCHGPTKAENGLKLDSYENVMKGTQFGKIITPGQPANSALVSVLRGTADPSIQMPHGGARMDQQSVQNIILWIEAGAPGPS